MSGTTQFEPIGKNNQPFTLIVVLFIFVLAPYYKLVSENDMICFGSVIEVLRMF